MVARKTSTKNSNTKNAELGFLAKALRGLGNLGGTTMGAMVGAPGAGGAIGHSLGAAVSKWLGAGDYTVSRNTITQRAASNIPMMHNNGQSIIVRHREFISSISGSVAFTVQSSLAINPGMAATFPWLSSIAARFQEYEFKGMVFHYVPTSGTFNGTTAALGSVMLQTTYRSTDSAPSYKAEMLNEYCANEVVPFETMAHPIECDPKENPFAIHYVRTGPIPSGEPLMYDLGTTFIATQGMKDTAVVGDLWVTYEVELKKPLISSPVVSSPMYFSRTYASPTTSSFFSGTAGPIIGTFPVTATAKTITIPSVAGKIFLVVEIYSGGLTSNTEVSWNGTLASSNINSWPYNGVNTTEGSFSITTNPVVGCNNLRWTMGVYLTDPSLPGTITFPNAIWLAGTTTVASVTCFTTGV
jgi:hypothetical protein